MPMPVACLILLVAGARLGLPAYGRRTQPFVGTIAVGAAPVALALDACRGHVFVLNNASGTVSMFDARRGTILLDATSGAVRRWVSLATGGWIGLGTRTQRAFLIADSPWVNVLDLTTGRVVRTLALGSAALAVAVSTRTGRA